MSAHRVEKPRAVVADTSAIIPFLEDDRVDLIEKHPGRFLIPHHVKSEITYKEQRRRYLLAVERKALIEVAVSGKAEKDMFSTLDRECNLGKGEISAMAVALAHGHDLAIRDERAIRFALAFAGCRGLRLGICRVEEILAAVVVNSRLSEGDALEILQRWKATQDIVPVTPFPDVLARLRSEARDHSDRSRR